LTVPSRLALTTNLESALHVTLYTAPTCPLSVATNFPVRPDHSRTEVSHEAEAAQRPSGEKHTCDIWRWWPVRRETGWSLPEGSVAGVLDGSASVVEVGSVVVLGEGEEDGKRDHKNSVWSSEPEMRSSGVDARRVVYRFRASCWAV
jgi:hypothetical protein